MQWHCCCLPLAFRPFLLFTMVLNSPAPCLPNQRERSGRCSATQPERGSDRNHRSPSSCSCGSRHTPTACRTTWHTSPSSSRSFIGTTKHKLQTHIIFGGWGEGRGVKSQISLFLSYISNVALFFSLDSQEHIKLSIFQFIIFNKLY